MYEKNVKNGVDCIYIESKWMNTID